MTAKQQGPLKNLFSGSLFSAVGMILGGLLTLATGIVLGRWLGPDSFGIYSLALITISVAAGIGTIGFDNCIARFSSLYLGNGEIHRIRGLIRYGIVRVLFCSSGAAVVLFILMRADLFDGTRLAPLNQVSILLLLGVPLYALQLALLQTVLGLQRIKSRIILEKILQPLFRLAFPFLVLLWVTQRTSAAAWPSPCRTTPAAPPWAARSLMKKSTICP